MEDNEIRRIVGETFNYGLGGVIPDGGYRIVRIQDLSTSQPIFTLFTHDFVKIMTIYPKETVRVFYKYNLIQPLTK